ncbi:MAG: hypothetical protein QW393_01345 [Candidatus Micrarchaeaceae archaeon]
MVDKINRYGRSPERQHSLQQTENTVAAKKSNIPNQGPEQPVLQTIENIKEPKINRFTKTHIAAIIIIMIFVAITAIYAYNRIAQHGQAPYFATTQTTTTMPPKAILINTNGTPLNYSDYLFGIPNIGAYKRYISSILYNATQYNMTAKSFAVNAYGLNFTGDFLQRAYHMNDSVYVPAKYMNYTYPIALIVGVIDGQNFTEALKFYNEASMVVNYLYFNLNLSSPFYNRTIYLLKNASITTMPPEHYLYKAVLSEYPFKLNSTGINATAIDIKPAYNAPIEKYMVLTQYKNYVIAFVFYGVLNHFNKSTGNAIVNHYYKVLMANE